MPKNKSSLEFITRPILKTELSILKSELETAIDEKNKKYRDEVLTGIDGVMNELQSMREENAAGVIHSERVDERLGNREERISKLESPVQ